MYSAWYIVLSRYMSLLLFVTITVDSYYHSDLFLIIKISTVKCPQSHQNSLLKYKALHFAPFLPWLFQLVSEWKPPCLLVFYWPSWSSCRSAPASPLNHLTSLTSVSALEPIPPITLCTGLPAVLSVPKEGLLPVACAHPSFVAFPWTWETMSLFRSAGMQPWGSALPDLHF